MCTRPLTPPEVIEPLDFEALLAERKARLISLYPADEQAAITATLALESEPIVRLLQESCYRELILRARYNDEARALMLAYATGSNLDHIGVTYYQEARLLVSPAQPAALPPVAAVYESDTDYRARLAAKPESYSTAGPAGAYEWHAKSASARVLDARAQSPSPCVVIVTVLAADGDGTPDQSLLAEVTAALSDETVRPLTDLVHVVPAQVTHYSIDCVLVVRPGQDPQIIKAEALAALRAYTSSRWRLGLDVTRSGIYAAAHRAGVDRVEINLAADISCNAQQAAYCDAIHVAIAGAADE